MTMLNPIDELKTVEAAMNIGDMFFNDIKDMPTDLALATISCVIDRYAYHQHIEEIEMYEAMLNVHKAVYTELGPWKESEDDE